MNVFIEGRSWSNWADLPAVHPVADPRDAGRGRHVRLRRRRKRGPVGAQGMHGVKAMPKQFILALTLRLYTPSSYVYEYIYSYIKIDPFSIY